MSRRHTSTDSFSRGQGADAGAALGRDLLETCARCDASGGVMIEAVSVVLGTIIASVTAENKARIVAMAVQTIRTTIAEYAEYIEYDSELGLGFPDQVLN